MWQKHYLKKGATVTTAQVEDPLSLGLIYPISAVLVTWELTTGGGEAAAVANEAFLEVKKDGSEVIFSEYFGMAVTLNQLLMPSEQRIADMGASVGPYYYVAVIPFGRYIGDPEYYLDPRGWASLDLTITQPTHTATTLAVYNVIVVRSIPPLSGSMGYFKFSNKRQFTSAAAHEYIELDRKHLYAAIIAGEMDGTSTDILSVVNELKLDCDAGVFSPTDLKETDIAILNHVMCMLDPDTDPATAAAHTNFIALNWVKPWLGESMLLNSKDYGKVEVDYSGAAAGTVRVAALELVKPGEIP